MWRFFGQSATKNPAINVPPKVVSVFHFFVERAWPLHYLILLPRFSLKSASLGLEAPKNHSENWETIFRLNQPIDIANYQNSENNDIILTCLFQELLLGALSNVLVDTNESQNCRRAAAIQLKNYLTSKDDNVKAQYQQRWLAFDANNKAGIKSNVSVDP